MLRSFLLLALSAQTLAYYAPGAFAASRCRPAVMKGQGTRGMPGKGATARGSQAGGFTKNSKKRIQQKEMSREEWTLVAAKGELGDEIGATMAVEAGQSPQSQNYIWTLIRGPEGAGQFDSDVPSNVWATDGSCRACTYPMIKAEIAKEDSGIYSMLCNACGSKWSLEDGSVMEWLPGNGPMQWMTKGLNKDKAPIEAGLLKTRVAMSGRVYIRLPDGTLKIEKTAAERADELAKSFQSKE